MVSRGLGAIQITVLWHISSISEKRNFTSNRLGTANKAIEFIDKPLQQGPSFLKSHSIDLIHHLTRPRDGWISNKNRKKFQKLLGDWVRKERETEDLNKIPVQTKLQQVSNAPRGNLQVNSIVLL